MKSLYERGIRFVKDILIESDCFISKESLELLLGTHVNFLLYQGFTSIIRRHIGNCHNMFNLNNKTQGPILPTYMAIFSNQS